MMRYNPWIPAFAGMTKRGGENNRGGKNDRGESNQKRIGSLYIIEQWKLTEIGCFCYYLDKLKSA